MTILTKEQVEELRLEHDKRKMSNDSNYEKCLDTIDHIYAKVEALERVKDSVGPLVRRVKELSSPFGEVDNVDEAIAAYEEAERKNFK